MPSKLTTNPITRARQALNCEVSLTVSQRRSLIQRLSRLAGKPKDIDSRICFGIEYYADETSADIADLVTRLQGNTYNGGWFHGMPCRRDPSLDYVVTQKHLDAAKPTDALIREGVTAGTKLYAVTV